MRDEIVRHNQYGGFTHYLAKEIRPGTFSMKSVATIQTDAQGEFVYKTTDFGEYNVTASKDGYGATPRPGALPNMFSGATFELSKDEPAQNVRFSLGRRGTLAARFIDADSGAPIEGLIFRAFAIGARELPSRACRLNIMVVVLPSSAAPRSRSESLSNAGILSRLFNHALRQPYR